MSIIVIGGADDDVVKVVVVDVSGPSHADTEPSVRLTFLQHVGSILRSKSLETCAASQEDESHTVIVELIVVCAGTYDHVVKFVIVHVTHVGHTDAETGLCLI